jgi:hypothetical protein
MERSVRIGWLAGVVVAALMISACSTVRKGEEAALSAAPAEDSEFVGQSADKMKKDPNRPYDRIWYDPKAKSAHFTSVYVAPVNTDYLKQMSWWNDASGAGLGTDRDKDVKEIADYFRASVQKAFKEDPKHRYQVVDVPTDNTLILEMAIIELVPTKVWLNTMTQLFVGAWNHGTIAFEARVRDGKSKEIIAAFADRQYGDTAVVSTADYSWWAHSKKVIDDWAQDMVNSANASPDEKVQHALPFDATPW